MEWMQILALVAGGMMLFAIWPMYKNWRANPTEAQPGDWSTAVCILGLVMLFVLMLKNYLYHEKPIPQHLNHYHN